MPSRSRRSCTICKRRPRKEKNKSSVTWRRAHQLKCIGIQRFEVQGVNRCALFRPKSKELCKPRTLRCWWLLFQSNSVGDFGSMHCPCRGGRTAGRDNCRASEALCSFRQQGSGRIAWLQTPNKTLTYTDRFRSSTTFWKGRTKLIVRSIEIMGHLHLPLCSFCPSV